MPLKLRKFKQWSPWFLWGFIILTVSAVGFDYGKHWVLKNALEKEMKASQGLISFASLRVSPWPLLQNHLILTDFHLNISGTPVRIREVSIRQGWRNPWHLALIQATDIKVADRISVQGGQGRLNISDLKKKINIPHLVLTNIHVTLPHFSITGPQASFGFLYDLGGHELNLQADIPEAAFASGVTFGLNGQGLIHTVPALEGKMDLKIKNIDTMMKEMVTAGVVKADQADLIRAGSHFLSHIGLRDMTVPLKIQEGEVFLGPVPLFKVGRS